jgi:hypothetical protein
MSSPMSKTIVGVAAMAVSMALGAMGCSKERATQSRVLAQPENPPEQAPDTIDRSPPSDASLAPPSDVVALGRWRLADPRELRRVVLPLSHILIRHAGAEPRQVAFSGGDLTSAPPPPPRSRAEAKKLAERVRKKASALPDEFAELAAKYSEDIGTGDVGGSFGNIIALQLMPWSQVLDAVSDLNEGGISRVVETQYGFHVFRLRPPSPEQTVSGARIVIGHEDAHWLSIQKCGDVPVRSRDEALRIALDIYQRLKREPHRFAEYARRYSEHCDSRQGGDFGTWSTHEPSPLPKEIEKLASLAVGEIAPPFDSIIGFEILERTPNRERTQYAMDPIRLPFDPSAPAGAPLSESAVRARAQTLAAMLSQDPTRFAELKAQTWAGAVETWTSGAGEPPLSEALDRLPIGAITGQPIRAGFTFTLARRIDPESLTPPPPTRFRLPTPAAPDFQYIVTHMQPEFFDAQLLAVARRDVQARKWSDSLAADFLTLHQRWASAEVSATNSRSQAFLHLQERLVALLGQASYAEYRRQLDQHFATLYLTPA